jgi:uncharacterized protein YbjQ (UPF0145 family)
MILTTTPAVEGRPAKTILGIVTGEAVSLNTLNDLGASLQNLGGDTSPVSEKLLFLAKERALRKMEDRAKDLGADAVVGVSFNGSSTAAGMLVFAAGTAVQLG